MSWPKLTGEISARYRPVGGVPEITYPSGTHIRFVAPGSVTDGQYGLFEWNMAAGPGGADPHFHTTFSESFYITSGTVSLFDGERWIRATPGEFVYVPARGIHAFNNDSGAPASMLILFAPGPPREKYFTELAEIRASGRVLTDEEWLELWARHDQYPTLCLP
jgi:mannose-6-phosphate isomerase-like protein (cupin superfamily)